MQRGFEGPFVSSRRLLISLETPHRIWATSRLEGRISWIFSSCSWKSRLTTWTAETRSGGLMKGQSPCKLLLGFSGFLSRRCRGLRPCVELVPEPEDSSPVPTWIFGDFWSLPRGVRPRLEWGHARALSSRAVAACHASLCVDQGICGFPSRFPTRVSHEAFPQGCPTGHRGVIRSSA